MEEEIECFELLQNSEASVKQEAISFLRQAAEAQFRKQRAAGQAALDWLQAEPTEEQVRHTKKFVLDSSGLSCSELSFWRTIFRTGSL